MGPPGVELMPDVNHLMLVTPAVTMGFAAVQCSLCQLVQDVSFLMMDGQDTAPGLATVQIVGAHFVPEVSDVKTVADDAVIVIRVIGRQLSACGTRTGLCLAARTAKRHIPRLRQTIRHDGNCQILWVGC